MALNLTKRGEYYYVKGTVRVGEKTIKRYETTGCKIEEHAEAYRAQLECQLRSELLDGRKVALNRLTFADAAEVYLGLDVHRNDEWRIVELCVHMEGYGVSDAKKAWRVFKSARCNGLKPSTTERFRKIAQAALNALGREYDFEAVKLEPIKFKNERIRFLTVEEQDKLLASYTAHVQPIALFLCYEGARTQECLQLKWRHVNFAKNTVYFNRTKNGDPRTVPMHPKVRKVLETMSAERNPEPGDHVFLNRFGEPYTDTRDATFQGGNPIAKAHKTACGRAGVTDFRVHDWRHHWASHHVMNRTPLETLRRWGGWKSLDMVQRYAAVSDDHMQEAIKNIA